MDTTPEVGKFITYCEAGFGGWARCECTLPHKRQFKASGIRPPKGCVEQWHEVNRWTLFNLGVKPKIKVDIDHHYTVYAGDRIAVCNTPTPVWKNGGRKPTSIEYFHSIREVAARYGWVNDQFRILILEERMVELENFIARHLYYAPGGQGAADAAADWNLRSKE